MAIGEDKYGNYYDSVAGQILLKSQAIGREHGKSCRCSDCKADRKWWHTYCVAAREQDKDKKSIKVIKPIEQIT